MGSNVAQIGPKVTMQPRKLSSALHLQMLDSHSWAITPFS